MSSAAKILPPTYLERDIADVHAGLTEEQIAQLADDPVWQSFLAAPMGPP